MPFWEASLRNRFQAKVLPTPQCPLMQITSGSAVERNRRISFCINSSDTSSSCLFVPKCSPTLLSATEPNICCRIMLFCQCVLQVPVLKSRSHPVNLVPGDPPPCCFISPPRHGFADLGGYLAGLGIIQIKISGHLHSQGQGSGGVLFVDGRGQNARFHIHRHGIEVVGW